MPQAGVQRPCRSSSHTARLLLPTSTGPIPWQPFLPLPLLLLLLLLAAAPAVPMLLLLLLLLWLLVPFPIHGTIAAALPLTTGRWSGPACYPRLCVVARAPAVAAVCGWVQFEAKDAWHVGVCVLGWAVGWVRHQHEVWEGRPEVGAVNGALSKVRCTTAQEHQVKGGAMLMMNRES